MAQEDESEGPRRSPRLSGSPATDTKKKKKDKKEKKEKKKREAEEVEDKPEAEPEAGEKKEKKKKKKKKTEEELAEKKSAHASPWMGGLPANASPQFMAKKAFGSAGGFVEPGFGSGGHKMPEGDEEENKKGKKRKSEEAEEEADADTKKKKKKKKKAEEAEAAEEAEEAPKKKKKDKKEKKDKKKKKEVEEEDDDEADFVQTKMEKGTGAESVGGDTGFKKDFYQEDPSVTAMPDSEVEGLRKQWTMVLSGDKCDFKPCMAFDKLGLDKKVLKITQKFEKPTAIQAQCWPVCLSGRDCIGVAETGSGKSLGFLLPAVVHILDQKPLSKAANGPICVVMSPTRELAMQTMEVAEEVSQLCDLKSVCIYGPQETALWKGVHIVVATPGRLKDLMNQGSCNLSRCTYAVLDEADRMLDAGFAPEIRFIMAGTHKQRQTLMFTATWPMEVQKMAMEFLHEANVYTMKGNEKEWKLQELLKKFHKGGNKILIFALYKKEAARLEQTLQRKGFNVGSIHGDKSQADRNRALAEFKDGKVPLLVATDVAARGLDIPNVEHVINVTFPLTIEDYVHRIGRTGRGGKTGEAHTFFTEEEKPLAGALVKVLQDAGQKVPEGMYSFGPLVTKKKTSGLYGDHFKDVDMTKKGTKITFG